MPTPVTTAKQCLTTEAAQALDEAVAIARRRGNAQTTSLHAMSAFLSLPSSPLRDACFRARNTAFYGGLYPSLCSQLRALDFALSLSLDRSPASQHRVTEPPISNSLMAAIKRSQANQRRQPDCFTFSFKQPQQLHHQELGGRESLGISGIKVEIQNLIVSILDDPIVSRVFNEAGFSSFDIKLAMVRPLQTFLRFNSRQQKRQQGFFWCNFEDDNSDHPAFVPLRKFPFSGDSHSVDDDGDDFRRIREVMAREQGRNPLLLGVRAYDVLRGFVEAVQKSGIEKEDRFLPLDLRGSSVVSIETEVLKFSSDTCCNPGSVNGRFEELGSMIKRCCESGLLLSFGDLKIFVKDDDNDAAAVAGKMDLIQCVVVNVTKLLEIHGGRVHLIGSSTYEVYLKFLNRFPSIEKDWDLRPLAVTSTKPSGRDASFKSSLMGSFVPLAGFFSSPDIKGPFKSFHQSISGANLCRDKYAQDVAAGLRVSAATQCQTTEPSWIQISESSPSNQIYPLKATDDTGVVRVTATGLHSKMENSPSHGQHPTKSKICGDIPPVSSMIAKEMAAKADDCSKCSINALDLQKQPLNRLESLGSSNPLMRPSKTGHSELVGCRSAYNIVNTGVADGQSQTYSKSGTSVRTDLMLGLVPPFEGEGKKEPMCYADKNLSSDFSDLHEDVGVSKQRSSRPYSEINDLKDFKSLFEDLIGRVGRQDEALRAICKTISHVRSNNEKIFKGSRNRGDVWLNFVGDDTFGQKITALELADILYGSRDNSIFVDLCSENCIIGNNGIFHCQRTNSSDVQLQRKTMVDQIAERLRKMPFSVVFLENLHCAHPPMKDCLIHAIKWGKFLDSYGREVSINNAIFVLASANMTRKKLFSSRDEVATFSQERITKVKAYPMQIAVCNAQTEQWKLNANPTMVNKRKIIESGERKKLGVCFDTVKRQHKVVSFNLDLNVPAEEIELAGDLADSGDTGNELFGRSSCPWLDYVVSHVDSTAVFKPLDYDSVGEKLMGLISECFSKNFCSECLLEIDSGVVDQVLVASCIPKTQMEVDAWVQNVLARAFVEAQKRHHHHSAHSAVKLSCTTGDSAALLPSNISVKFQP